MVEREKRRGWKTCCGLVGQRVRGGRARATESLTGRKRYKVDGEEIGEESRVRVKCQEIKTKRLKD
jgi:hypothetical protein